MSFMASAVGAAEEAARELPMPAWAYGLLAFGLLLSLLVATLIFGKGRSHS